MSVAFDIALRLRRWFLDDHTRALVRVDSASARREQEERERIDAPARELQQNAHLPRPTICLGTACDSTGAPYPVTLPAEEIQSGGHWTITGTTGCGKSYFAASVLMQLVRKNLGSVLLIDMKGELTRLLRETLVPSILAAAPPEEAVALLKKLVIIAPFDEDSPPPFQVLARDTGLPIEVQAHEVSKSFGRTIGRDLGVLQETTLRHALVLAIELGLTLVDVRRILQDEQYRREHVERSTNREVREYFLMRFQRERQGSLHSLLSRLDTLLMYPSLRRMLTTPGMLRFDRLLENSITLVDMGGAPAGLRDVPQFLGQLFFQKLVRQIFSRRVTQDSRPAVIFADEFQELLTPEVAADFERVLTLARSQRVFLRLLFQQPAQVEAASPNLLRILRTNCTYQMLFKTSLEDARHFGHILPVTGSATRDDPDRFPDPRTPPRRLTAEEERAQMLTQIPSMPARLFWFWNRNREYPALLVRSPTLAVQEAERSASRLPPAIRELARRGILACNRAEEDEPEGHDANNRSAEASDTKTAMQEEATQQAPEERETNEPNDIDSRSAQAASSSQSTQRRTTTRRRRGRPRIG